MIILKEKWTHGCCFLNLENIYSKTIFKAAIGCKTQHADHHFPTNLYFCKSFHCFRPLLQYESRCTVNSSTLISCPTPAVGPEARRARVKVHFLMDSLHFDFSTVGSEAFSYEPNPQLYPLNRNDPGKPYHHKPGSIISVEVGAVDETDSAPNCV